MGSAFGVEAGAHLVARTRMPNRTTLRKKRSNFPASVQSLLSRGTNLTTFTILEVEEETDARGDRRAAPVPPPTPRSPSNTAAKIQRDSYAASEMLQQPAAEAAAGAAVAADAARTFEPSLVPALAGTGRDPRVPHRPGLAPVPALAGTVSTEYYAYGPATKDGGLMADNHGPLVPAPAGTDGVAPRLASAPRPADDDRRDAHRVAQP